MRTTSALKIFHEFDTQGRYVFGSKDLVKIFSSDNYDAFQAGLKRLVNNGILLRCARSVYIFAYSRNLGADSVELIARSLRRGHYNYVSLESALSQYGAISQIPVDRLTIMTTGREGEFKTPFGVIDFTHTQRSVSQIVANTCFVDRPLRIATRKAAFRDLKRIGRNVHLVDQSQIYD